MPNHAESENDTSFDPIEGLIESGRFYIGPDIQVAEDVVVPQVGENEGIIAVTGYVEESGLPGKVYRQETDITEILEMLSVSARSRGAQLGLMVFLQQQVRMDDPFTLPEDRPTEPGIVREGDRINLPLLLVNRGKRPLIIKKGEGIGCLYSEIGAQELTGQGLVKAVGQGIEFGGNYGETWFYADSENRSLALDEANRAEMVGLVLSPQRLDVSAGSAVEVFGNGIRDYRTFLKEQGILVPVKPGQHPPFWIGETAGTVRIDAGFNGLLHLVQAGNGFIFQTLSLLIKGGETKGWPIRVELEAEEGRFADMTAAYGQEPELVPVDFDSEKLVIYMSLYRNRR